MFLNLDLVGCGKSYSALTEICFTGRSKAVLEDRLCVSPQSVRLVSERLVIDEQVANSGGWK
jgi:hypothetical protein